MNIFTYIHTNKKFMSENKMALRVYEYAAPCRARIMQQYQEYFVVQASKVCSESMSSIYSYSYKLD